MVSCLSVGAFVKSRESLLQVLPRTQEDFVEVTEKKFFLACVLSHPFYAKAS